jgi:hypothetical protein
MSQRVDVIARAEHGNLRGLSLVLARSRCRDGRKAASGCRKEKAPGDGPLSATVTPAPRAKSLSNSDAPTPFPEAASQPRAQDSIAPANWIATSANSKPSAVRTLLPARSRGICMKMLATWPVRTPQLQNTWRPVAVGRKSRYCSPVSSGSCASRLRGPNGVRDEFLLAATAQNLRRLARLRPVNMLPETTRHITPPSAAEEPPKRPWPILLEILHASHQSEYFTAFSTVSAHSGRLRRRIPDIIDVLPIGSICPLRSANLGFAGTVVCGELLNPDDRSPELVSWS